MLSNFSLFNWNQLSSEKLSNMIKYSWKSAGYIEHNISFKSVKEICFECDSIKYGIKNCDEFFFMKCSHCNRNLCMNHFFFEYHFHDIKLFS